ncbi:uncharacterized protein [Primulina huaijiensis]|uniref:uncharacterized protein isoform X2 n=1 Tax=Primulina huaijiensis TaxID=1492673 RepID=UPI003CC74A0B
MKGKQRYNHTMSRRGYARLAHIMEKTSSADIPITRTKVWVEGHKKKNGQLSGEAVGEKMKEIEECAPESQNTTNIAEDAISLVFGKEIRGRVRGMGFGVTPSKVGASLQQNETFKQLQSMMHNLQQEVQQMRLIVFQNMRQQNEQEQVGSGGSIGIGNDIGSGCDINRPKKSGNADNVNQHQVASRIQR